MGLEEKLTFRNAKVFPYSKEVLTSEALRFVAELVNSYQGFREWLLDARQERQERNNADIRTLCFPERWLDDDYSARDDPSWKVAGHPDDLKKRVVEITGPVERKMIINALNSGADCFMADFEDSFSPTWQNIISGQKNLIDAVKGTIEYQDLKTGKQYTLKEKTATLLVRPRGLHLPENHVLFDGKPVPAAFFDFGLYFFHNAQKLIDKGSGPYFYLPKMESCLEAKLWKALFAQAEDTLKISHGTIRATVLIETLPAVFQMEEILHELKEYASGLNCGRWDYLFSYAKTLQNHPDKILPDRDQVGMDQNFLESYAKLLIQICHKRGAYAMGGMAAQIPVKDQVENEKALKKVRADKEREVTLGHDGTWVAHPGLVPIAREIFEKGMNGRSNQFEKTYEGTTITREDLLETPYGNITDEGVFKNIKVGIQYLEAWIRGSGCVPLYNLMEDAATAEISRTQIWQWLRHGKLTPRLYAIAEGVAIEEIKREIGEERYNLGKFADAVELFRETATSEKLVDFLTLPAYEHLCLKELMEG